MDDDFKLTFNSRIAIMMESRDIALKLTRASFFLGTPPKALERLATEGEVLHVEAGEVIIREGEYEMVCFVILSGSFHVFVTDTETHEKRKVRTLGAGELLGEMSVLSGTPRHAEVTCAEDAFLLRIEKEEFLAFLDEAPVAKERLDAEYRRRSLTSALKALDVFSVIEGPTIETLAQKVELVVAQKGEVIFSPGQMADAIYLIRDGFVKLSRDSLDTESEFFDSRFDKVSFNPKAEPRIKEYILAYMGQGAYFGEVALFHNRPRVATATALTRTELVKINKVDFDKLLFRYPEVRAELQKLAESRYLSAPGLAREADQDMVRWATSQDIFGSDAVLFLDLNHCARCLNCITACAKLHDGVTRITHNGIRYKNILIPTSCRHCRQPTCMIGCPTGAIQRDKTGEVYHLDTCIGCGTCARGCPFGNISIVEIKERQPGLAGMVQRLLGLASDGKTKRKAVKCDMCKDYKYRGCQHNCPTKAIVSARPSEYFTGASGGVGL
ncbi:MAG: cyclic nucleotide-binding domain-containing protein [Nitrospinota bacterium]|nr:cyclic nucleotide-binding domain-containing protein [Nitrospinota bacterium]